MEVSSTVEISIDRDVPGVPKAVPEICKVGDSTTPIRNLINIGIINFEPVVVLLTPSYPFDVKVLGMKVVP